MKGHMPSLIFMKFQDRTPGKDEIRDLLKSQVYVGSYAPKFNETSIKQKSP